MLCDFLLEIEAYTPETHPTVDAFRQSILELSNQQQKPDAFWDEFSDVDVLFRTLLMQFEETQSVAAHSATKSLLSASLIRLFERKSKF